MTLGLEWELFPLRTESIIDNRYRNQVLAFEQAPQFTRLFGLFGHDGTSWVQNLIPNRVLRSIDRKSLESLGVIFGSARRKISVSNFPSLNGEQLHALLTALFNVDNLNISVRPIRSQWTPSHFLANIPDQLSLEYLRNRYQGLELAMNGYVNHPVEGERFLIYFWRELGILPPGETTRALSPDHLHVHAHGVPNIAHLPREQRLPFYQGTVGFWGSTNDAILANNLTFPLPLSNGTAQLNFEQASQVFYAMLWRLYSVNQPLTRETYNRLVITPDGVIVRQRARDHVPEADPNFPEVFRYLWAVRLRGIYGQQTVPEGSAVPIVGLEVNMRRGGETEIMQIVRNSFDLLPAQGQRPLTLSDFEPHRIEGDRGLVSSLRVLRQTLDGWNLPNSILDNFDAAVRGSRYRWSPPVIRAFFFAPLTNWLDHPLAQYHFARMSPQWQGRIQALYDRALRRYRLRLAAIIESRLNPDRLYEPDWLPSGISINILSTRAKDIRPNIKASRRSSDEWFQISLLAESIRFFSESDLTRVIRMPTH